MQLPDYDWFLILPTAGILLFIAGLFWLTMRYRNLDGIKAKTVGDGQHGTARWSTPKEIRNTYDLVPFRPQDWRAGKNRPTAQGVILGSQGKAGSITALVDTDDVHALMIGASGIGKTAYFLYPNLEYACACGMSFLCTDTKGDLFRNYATIAKEHYDYNIAVIDLRNPTRSHGNNMLHLVNKYMDIYRAHPENIAAKARAEKYAKIIAKTIINSGGEAQNHGQNQFFYDAAEGLLTSAILLLAEYLPPGEDGKKKRHIISVYKLVQELLEPSKTKGKSQFQMLMAKLPDDHKAKWFAGAALNSAEQAMLSVMSTVLSRLNCFLDSELEQILCFDSAIDAEKFCNEKSAIFIVMPEENPVVYFLVSLMIQQLYREILSVADEKGGKLDKRVMFYCDELGTMPAIESLELIFSASRSRRLMMVPIIQSFAQLERNYGKEGAEIIADNCQATIFGGFAPNSQTAEVLSKALGSRTVMSGSVSRGQERGSSQLQMMERPLMTPDELKSLPKGQFVVMKTGVHPMQTRLRLFLDWGISFGQPYELQEQGARQVAYAGKDELERSITRQYYATIELAGEVEGKAAAASGHSDGREQTATPGERGSSRRKKAEQPLTVRTSED